MDDLFGDGVNSSVKFTNNIYRIEVRIYREYMKKRVIENG